MTFQRQLVTLMISSGMCWVWILWWFAGQWAVLRISGGVILEEAADMPPFQFGRLHLQSTKLADSTVESSFRATAMQCIPDEVDFVQYLLARWRDMTNKTIADLVSTWKFTNLDTKAFEHTSALTLCSAKLKYDKPLEAEILDQLSLLSYPWNYATAKNYGFSAELSGHYHIARSLYEDCYQHSGDVGCLLHSALASPIFSYSSLQAQYAYLRMLRTFYHGLRHIPSTWTPGVDVRDFDYAYMILREMPLSSQHMGYAPGRGMELLSLSIAQHYPVLTHLHNVSQIAIPGDISPPFGSVGMRSSGGRRKPPRKIRVGVFSERFGNTSPGLCMQSVLKHLAIQYNGSLEIVFFDRGNLVTVFAETMRQIAVETINISETSVLEAVRTIGASKLDVLLYLALPTDKHAFLVAHVRLAPIQIQVGIGHPLSSGVAAGIDYAVVPADMLPQHSSATSPHVFSQLDTAFLTSRRIVDSRQCAFYASLCTADELDRRYIDALQQPSVRNGSLDNTSFLSDTQSDCALPEECYSARHSAVHYVEQLVVFETMSHVALDPTSFHKPIPAQHPNDHLPNNKNAEEAQRSSVEVDGETFEDHRGAHLYNVLQSLARHRHVLPAHSAAMLPANYPFLSCQELNDTLMTLNLLSWIPSPEEIGCYHRIYESNSDGQNTLVSVSLSPPRVHLYFAVQFVKKLQSPMDDLFLRILRLDPLARIVVKADYEVVLPRLLRLHQQLYGDSGDNVTLASLRNRFLWISGRIGHESYLGLVGLSRVFLNSVPMGAGMTSSEAIAMCTPIVTWPEATNVLHFAQAQLQALRTLTVAELQLLTAVDAQDYAAKAVALATMHSSQSNVDFLQVWQLREHLCEGRALLFDDSDPLVRHGGQSTSSASDALRETTLWQETQQRSTLAAVTREWAEFLHRVVAW